MEELFSVIMIALVGGGTIIALLVTLSYLLPDLSGRTGQTLVNMPGRSFILGAVNFIFFFAVAAVFAQIGEQISGALGSLFNLAALTIALIILSVMAMGLTGLVLLLAGRIAGGESLTARRRFGAATLLVAAGLAPVIGWLVLTPFALLLGLGAAIIATVQWVSRRTTRREAPV